MLCQGWTPLCWTGGARSVLVSSPHPEECSSECLSSALGTQMQAQPGGTGTARNEFCCALGQRHPGGALSPQPRLLRLVQVSENEKQDRVDRASESLAVAEGHIEV